MAHEVDQETAFLALVGSHENLDEAQEGFNRKNLAKLISLKHGVAKGRYQIIQESQLAKEGFHDLLSCSPATEKHIYYVGHGGDQGELVFDDAKLFLETCLPSAEKLHEQTLYLHLFMCYQHEAIDSMSKQLKGARGMYQWLNLADVKLITQRVRDEMNNKILAYLLKNSWKGITTQLTVGDTEFGHKNLQFEVQYEEEKLRQ